MELVELEVQGSLSADVRYDVLERLARVVARRGVVLTGFDLTRAIRVLLEGEPRAVGEAVRALKSGTVQRSHACGRPIGLGRTCRRGVVDPREALVELHRAAARGGDPLGTPWSSHRDLLGFRTARFFDAGWWSGRVDPRWVHLRCGGGDLPASSPRPSSDGLDLPLRVSAAVMGVLPADPASFRLFSQLARWNGSRQVDIARALMLTPRRIRQLQAQHEPRLRTAAVALGDQRLRRVP